MKQRIFIIGHTGFIGKAISKELTARKMKFLGIATKECDLRKPQSVSYLARILKKDVIVIITASINRELGDTLNNMQTHINMIANIARALESNPVKKCVYLSSADVYGHPRKLPITEESTINPQTYYALAKYTCEKTLEATAQKFNFPLLVLRYNGVFGPGQTNIGYGPNAFIQSLLEDGVIKLWGNGKERRDSIYVKDLAKVIVKLCVGNASGVYNIATGKSRSFRNMIEILQQIFPKKIKIISKKRTSPQFDQVFDSTKLKTKLARFHFMTMKQALEETIEEVKDHFNQLN